MVSYILYDFSEFVNLLLQLHSDSVLGRQVSSIMGTNGSEDPLKGMDWKTFAGEVPNRSGEPVVKKRLPRRIRQIPEYYFLPRRSLPSAIAFYGAICAAGVGAGMLVEIWINKKIQGVLHIITVTTRFTRDQ